MGVEVNKRNNDRIYLSSPHMSEEGYEQDFIKKAFDTNWIAPMGTNVDEFEKEIESYVDIGHAAAVSSGTAAIHLALKAADVNAGDIVICQSLTFSATANPILYQGATPVFIDSDEQTWNMDPVLLRKALEQYPQAKAVIVVHLYGLSADMDRIIAICNEYGVALIEDAAESLGTTYKGEQTGTMGRYGIYSFNGNKIITTSGGGMLVSNDRHGIEKARFWATQSRDQAPYYQHSELGYNYRMSNVLAGIGRGQLKVLDQRIAKKREIFNRYREELGQFKEIQFMPHNQWNDPNFWLSVITLETMDPYKIIDALQAENIESRPIWKPMHLQPIFEKFVCFGGSCSERLFSQGVCLPSDTKMVTEDLDRITSIIKRVIRNV